MCVCVRVRVVVCVWGGGGLGGLDVRGMRSIQAGQWAGVSCARERWRPSVNPRHNGRTLAKVRGRGRGGGGGELSGCEGTACFQAGQRTLAKAMDSTMP